MDGLLAKYADSSEESDSDSTPKQNKRNKPEKTNIQQKDSPQQELDNKDSLAKSKELLRQLKEQEPEESDSESSDGDFVHKAKKFKREVEQPEAVDKKLAGAKEELEELDPVAKSLFSILPAPKNTVALKPANLPKQDALRAVSEKGISRDEDEAEFLQAHNKVQLPKAQVTYSTDKPTDNPAGNTIELSESDLRDATWKRDYLRPADEVNKMKEYLHEHSVGKEERSKNQITHLAYQSIKQQMSEVYSKVQKPEKDGRRRYGW
eukprot:TRINITY_DN10426_c0_g7_i3.p1 TRINITY_DN10426_c0_g7~~TRINITY_DN10426_c0_g7_i3.p1  ORF type:complete len:264 (-),score=84.66 TRINITY_DN10426_c0_g7_i3:126-917(-)